MSKLRAIFDRLAQKQDGAVAVIVTLMLGVLFTSLAFSVAVGAERSARISTTTAAETAALEAARDCQASGSCSIASIKAHLKSLKLVETYGVSSDSIDVTMLSTDSTDASRTKVTISLSRPWYIPMSELLWASNSQTVRVQASAIWSTNASSRGDKEYFPLMVNQCLLSKLRIPSQSNYVAQDSKHTCGSNNDPEVFFFGNGGGAGFTDVVKRGGDPCEKAYTHALASPKEVKNTPAMPTGSCAPGGYWFPLFSEYQTTKTTTTYVKTWVVSYTVTEKVTTGNGQNAVITYVTSPAGNITYMRLCNNIDDAFSACTDMSTPVNTVTCNTNKCNTPSAPVLISTVAQAATSNIPDQAITKGFVFLYLDSYDPGPTSGQNSTATHTFTLRYAGHDIRLLPN